MGFSLITIFEIGQYIAYLIFQKLKCSKCSPFNKKVVVTRDCSSCRVLTQTCRCQTGPTLTEEIRYELNGAEATELKDNT